MSGHKAKTWVEEHFPSATGNTKAMLILTYGAGLDAGLEEAQQAIETLAVMKEGAELVNSLLHPPSVKGS